MAKKLAFDRLLFSVVVFLVGFGLVMIYSASAAMARGLESDVNPYLVRQATSAVIGLVGMGLAMSIDYRHLKHPVVTYTIVCGVIALLVGALLSPELNRTHRWLFVGGTSVQPSELAKISLVLFAAYQIDRKEGRTNQTELLLPVGAVTAITMGLVVLEPDLSSALLLGTAVALVLFLAGLSWRYLLGAAAAALPAIWVLVLAVPYRRARFFSFLHPEDDPLGSGFQALQSLIAVGSGGVLGRGLGNSLQKLHFVPYPHSDFIFSILAEEFGLVGSIVLLALFAVLFWRAALAGSRAPDLFGRYLAWGLGSLLFVQALIHASVAVALLPSTGVPLPFVTYGGSSLVATLLGCGLLLNVSQHA